jgi:hypothetical protein
MIRKIGSRVGTALVVAGCLAVGACGTAGSDPELVTVASGDLVTIDGTSVSVPGRVEGLGKPTQGGQSDVPRHVTFVETGPVDGTITGSLTVATWTDAAITKALAGLSTTAGAAEAAAAVGQSNRMTKVLRAGEYIVLKVVGTDVIPGAGLGYPDRVYHDYLFAGSDGRSVVSVTTDVLSEAEVINYIAAITA